MSKSRVTIVGAGLVGSLLALVLKKDGFEVDVFEKRGDLRLLDSTEHRSINLVITSRGIEALSRAGILQRARDLSVPVYGRMIHSKKGESVFQPYGKENEFNLSISRFELNKMLIEAAEDVGVQFHFSHVANQIDLTEKRISFSNLSNGADIDFQILLATDGAGSQLRKNLIDQYPNEYSEAIDWLNLEYIELEIPKLENGKPQIDNRALHIWPRGHHMMMALANLDGSFTVTLYLPPNDSLESFNSIKSQEDVKKLFEEHYPDAIALIPDYQSAFLERRPGRLGTVRLSKWHYGNSVALIGDSAHAIVPFFGQGMNLGFEDVCRLQENWQKYSRFNFEEYSQNQMPNANAIADMAIENWIEMGTKVADPEFLLQKQIESKLESTFPKLYKSRYGMVTYTLIPYATIQKIGKLQQQILNQLKQGLKDIEDLDLTLAKSLIEEKLVPHYRKLGVQF